MPPRIRAARPGRRLAAEDFKLVGPRKDIVRLRGSLLDSSYEPTIDGATAVTLVVFDPNRNLLRSRLIRTLPRLTLDGDTYQLCHVAYENRKLTLTFEPVGVAAMRTVDDPKTANRATVTRAGFVGGMVRETERKRHVRIRYRCPEEGVRQPIARTAGGD